MMMIRLLFLLLFAFAGMARAEEPLPPEQAFRFSARVVDAKTIEARWQITDQYYMYRDKFKFALDGGTLGAEAAAGQGEGRRELRQCRGLPQGSEDPAAGRSRRPGYAEGGLAGLLGRWHLLSADQPGCEADLAGAAGPSATVSPVPSERRRPDQRRLFSASAAADSGDESSRIAGLFKGDNLALVLVSFLRLRPAACR
jgi:hypothetical protein